MRDAPMAIGSHVHALFEGMLQIARADRMMRIPPTDAGTLSTTMLRSWIAPVG